MHSTLETQNNGPEIELAAEFCAHFCCWTSARGAWLVDRLSSTNSDNTDKSIVAHPPVAPSSIWEWLIWIMAWCMVPFEMWFAYVICFLHTQEWLLLTNLAAEFRCYLPVLFSGIILQLGKKMYWKKWSKQVCMKEESRAFKVRRDESRNLCFSNSWISWSLPFYFSPAEELNRRLELR